MVVTPTAARILDALPGWPDDIAQTLALDVGAVASVLRLLHRRGLVERTSTGWVRTREGRDALSSDPSPYDPPPRWSTDRVAVVHTTIDVRTYGVSVTGAEILQSLTACGQWLWTEDLATVGRPCASCAARLKRQGEEK